MSDEPHAGGSSFTIRSMVLSDAPVIQEILQGAPQAANWSEVAIRSSLYDTGTLAFVSTLNQEITGCIFGTRLADEAEILNLAVQFAYRRKGIARAMVQQILHAWQQGNVQRIFLEVRESNLGAIKLYEGLGFQKAGRRKKYYSEPEEDALVLEWHSTKNNPQVGTR